MIKAIDESTNGGLFIFNDIGSGQSHLHVLVVVLDTPLALHKPLELEVLISIVVTRHKSPLH